MTEETAAPVEGQAAPDAAPAMDAPWYDGFSDELKGYAETKGFKSAESALDGYRNLEKLRGVPADQIVQWPTDADDREAMMPVYTKMGMPATAGDYTNVLGDGFSGDVFNAAAERAHMLGIGDGQFQGMQAIMSEQAVAQQEAMDEKASADFDAWKSGNGDGFNNAARLMSDVGVSEESLEGLLSGDKSAMYDFLAKVAERTADAQVIQGDAVQGDGFAMSPSAAKQKISELNADPEFNKQHHHSDKKIRQVAIDRMSKLYEIAARA